MFPHGGCQHASVGYYNDLGFVSGLQIDLPPAIDNCSIVPVNSNNNDPLLSVYDDIDWSKWRCCGGNALNRYLGFPWKSNDVDLFYTPNESERLTVTFRTEDEVVGAVRILVDQMFKHKERVELYVRSDDSVAMVAVTIGMNRREKQYIFAFEKPNVFSEWQMMVDTQSILDTFDLSICRIAFRLDSYGRVEWTARRRDLMDIANRSARLLRVNRLHNGRNTTRRIGKYRDGRGFAIDTSAVHDELIAVARASVAPWRA